MMGVKSLTPNQLDALAGWLSALRPGQPRWTKRALAEQLTFAIEDGLVVDALALTIGATRYTLAAVNVAPDNLASRGTHWDFTGLTTSTGALIADPHCPRCSGIHGPEGPLDEPGSLCRTARSADIKAHAEAAKAALKGTDA